jgi:hypothetical protein
MRNIAVWGTLIVAGGSIFSVHGQQLSAPSEKPYRIIDGKVDEATFRGWRAYHSACHTCHGVDGTGTSIAPNLVARVKDLSANDFTIKVLTSYRIVLQSGDTVADDATAIRQAIAEEVSKRGNRELNMPAWEGDPKVRPRLLDLYAYLRARADGALGPGRPEQLQ